MTYAMRRRIRPIVYLLVVVLALPPGFGTNRVYAGGIRTGSQQHGTKMETFRNPQFSSSRYNRFLYTNGPRGLVDGGGESLRDPGRRGYGARGGPQTLWLTNGGRLEWADTDLALPGVGLPLSFERMWRGSVSSYDGPLGTRWEFNWNRRLFEEEDADVVFYDMGRWETYDEQSGSYTSPVGRYDVLAKDTAPTPDIFTRTDQYGVVETYEDEGSGWYRLDTIQDLNGNTISFAYDGSSRLETVTDTLGQDTTLYYDASDRISKISDHASREWLYAYDGGGNLSAVTTPTVDPAGTEDDYTSGKTTTYLYDGSDRLSAIKLPGDGGTPTILVTYDGSGDITEQTLNGSDYTATYNTTNKIVTIVDRAGDETRYLYDASDRISKRRVFYTASDYWETSYTYNSDHEVTLVTFPRGNRVEYSYDASGNISKLQYQKNSGDTSTPVEWTYTYNSYGAPTQLTDPEGNDWVYEYDSDGNLTKKTWPAITVPSGIATSDKNSDSNYDGTISESYEYGSTGLMTKLTDPLGTVTEYEYTTVNSKDAYLYKVKRDTGVGNLNLVTTYDYDGAGNVTKVTDPEGHITTYTVNELNQVLMAVEPLSVTRKTHYDLNDRVTKTEASNDTAVGNSWYVETHTYDAIGNRTTTVADATSSTTLTTAYDYDGEDQLTKVTSPDGNVTEYVYDPHGLTTEVTRKAVSAANDAITTMTYDGNGNRTTLTDPESNATIYAYDLLDRLTKETLPEGHYQTLAYDDNSALTKQSSYNSAATKLAETTSSYDEAGRLYQTEMMAKKANLTTDIGDGQQTKTLWRAENDQVVEYAGDVCGCSAYTFDYDALGRRITSTDPLPSGEENSLVTEYDKNGNVTKQTSKQQSQNTGLEADKDIEVTLVFDARDRMVTKKEKIDASTNAETLYFYGLRDQVTKVTDPEGRVAKTEHNEQLWRTKETHETAGDDVITEYVYDDDGMVLTYRAKNTTTGDQQTFYTYDKLGRRVTTEWPNNNQSPARDYTLQTYDKASNRISTTDPDGTVVVCAYDDNNRLTSKDMTLGSIVVGADAIDYGYDGMGRMTSADLNESTSFGTVVEWTYNTLGESETEKQVIDGFNSGAGRAITYDWNVSGQKTGVTYPVSGDVITYTRDALDRVDKITRGSTELVDYTFSGPRILKKAFPGSEVLYTYDTLGRLTKIHHKDSSSTNTLAQFDYGFDKSHQITSMDKIYYDDVQNTRVLDDTKDEGDQYAYDGAKRLVTVLRGVPTAKITTAMATNITNGDYDDKVEYHYDQTGNRLTLEVDDTNQVTYAHNKVNEMTTEGTSSPEYTLNGNYTRSGNLLKYNFENKLSYQVAGSVTYTWHYDALGRLVQRDRSDQSAENRTYYDYLHQIERVSFDPVRSTESARRSAVYGPRIDELIEHTDRYSDPDDIYYAHADHLGSVQVLAEADGTIGESYRYTEFGETTVVDTSFVKLSTAISPVKNWVRYTGRVQGYAMAEPYQTWYEYRARHYRADVGRFVQRDPLDYIGSANTYAYVLNDPVNSKDPLGLDACASSQPLAKCVCMRRQCRQNAKAFLFLCAQHWRRRCRPGAHDAAWRIVIDIAGFLIPGNSVSVNHKCPGGYAFNLNNCKDKYQDMLSDCDEGWTTCLDGL